MDPFAFDEADDVDVAISVGATATDSSVKPPKFPVVVEEMSIVKLPAPEL